MSNVLDLKNIPAEGDIVEVRLLNRLSRPLHYRVPPPMETPSVGAMVDVPLGRRNEPGIVLGRTDSIDFDPSKLKYVLNAPYSFPVVSKDIMDLAFWVASYYGCSQEAVYERLLPSAIRKGASEKLIRYMSLNGEPESEVITSLKRRAPKQYQLIELLRTQPQPIKKQPTLNNLGISVASYNGLLKKGMIRETSEIAERIGYDDELGQTDVIKVEDFPLTEEQLVAVAAISAKISLNHFSPILLHGVTGSGKTEVYVRAIKEALKTPGATALFLVPEVALAPQTVSSLRSRLEAEDEKVVVWHSHLSDGERRDSWLKIARGESRIVVGARSAIFSPLNNLKLVIVDEEHEPAYKQEETPRYHARDLAIVRAKLNSCTCILGSATPSLESLYNVKAGKYEQIRLTKRVDNRELPKFTLVDMRMEYRKTRKENLISQTLKDAIRERMDKGEQVILFLNRRGYSNQMLCAECGWIAMSDQCSVPLTYHRRQNKLKCHLTGYETPAPQSCPECGSRAIRGEGYGTQKLEDAVRAIEPRAKLFRVDADTMSKKNLFRHVLSDFRKGKIDILVGTQMLAKGLDFPNVTLVAMINADHSLYIEDFRATERTFQLLVQVSGRAGRGERSGEVIVQTSTPHASPIQYARRSDFEGFLEEEIALRQEFNYPPFRHLIRHLVRGKSLEKVSFYSQKWREHLDSSEWENFEVRGPIPSNIEKLDGQYRYQLWYFTTRIKATVAKLEQLQSNFTWDSEIQQSLDVDAINLS